MGATLLKASKVAIYLARKASLSNRLTPILDRSVARVGRPIATLRPIIPLKSALMNNRNRQGLAISKDYRYPLFCINYKMPLALKKKKQITNLKKANSRPPMKVKKNKMMGNF